MQSVILLPLPFQVCMWHPGTDNGARDECPLAPILCVCVGGGKPPRHNWNGGRDEAHWWVEGKKSKNFRGAFGACKITLYTSYFAFNCVTKNKFSKIDNLYYFSRRQSSITLTSFTHSYSFYCTSNDMFCDR